MPLTPKQERFVEEYLVDLNATQACIRAGYSEKTAGAIGTENLSKPLIQQAISEKRSELSERTAVTAEKVVAALATVAFANIGDYFTADSNGSPCLNFEDLTAEQTAAISEITVDRYVVGKGEDARPAIKVKFKLHDKLRALEQLGKYLSLFVTRVEHLGEVTVTYEISDRERMRRMALFLLEDQGSGTVIEHDGAMNGAGELSDPSTHSEMDH